MLQESYLVKHSAKYKYKYFNKMFTIMGFFRKKWV